MQHTGSFKARGALNFLRAHPEEGSLPEAGVTIASGGNASLACAWARRHGIRATVFLPETAPQVKTTRPRCLGANVRLAGHRYAEAQTACEDFAAATGALEDTVIVAVSGGLFAGVATAAQRHSIRTIGVEPENCRALNAAVEAGHLVDVEVGSVAANSSLDASAPPPWP
ncbi:hypothetical protein SSP24_81530 [Streptomyces spinoverrucosus]|uniref:Tryptophan synthase beta chain-like PALP domain-containing protein n=1 Tax=Streptomyces spinoverrucosus TaxID=284043 RepID=A0A4Y3VW75_9ACTN|nr:hypothetical protein SSP24_81530 [Streptomyces spinoverrucosus]GHB96240.1 hypothetical protein GCM10010397_81070 [Streptomyces spinoverrucosus]